MTLSPARLGPHTVWPSVRPLWLTQYELYGVLLMTLSPARSQRTPHCVAERQASLVNPILVLLRIAYDALPCPLATDPTLCGLASGLSG